jgi:hypothetical protein
VMNPKETFNLLLHATRFSRIAGDGHIAGVARTLVAG